MHAQRSVVHQAHPAEQPEPACRRAYPLAHREVADLAGDRDPPGSRLIHRLIMAARSNSAPGPAETEPVNRCVFVVLARASLPSVRGRGSGPYDWFVTQDVSGAPHSAAFFNPQRDFWWNEDYLQLIAGRFGLGGVRSALDVGAGVGHWGRLLLPLLAPEATIVGVERDPRWVTEAREEATSRGIDHRCSYVQGVAEALPFDDETFDLVTCQTLLIHIADVPAVIGEMVRVLCPGGLLLVAEPNNLAGQLVADSTTRDQATDEVLERVAFALICERGKAALGEGDSSVGDLLPGYFASARLVDVQTFLNDKTFELVPPYASPAQEALRAAILEDAKHDRADGLSEAEAKRYYLAGGGAQDEFSCRWQRRQTQLRETARQLTSNQLHTAGGGLHYVVAGRRSRDRARPDGPPGLVPD